jgi:anti-sigma factor RsiW
MEINHENYESWLLDYIEGNLSPGQIMAVHRFLDQHPDLKAELESWKEAVLVPDPGVVFPDKDKLYRRRRIAWLAWMQPLGAAAALIAFFLAFFPDRFPAEPKQPGLASETGRVVPDREAPVATATDAPAPAATAPVATATDAPAPAATATVATAPGSETASPQALALVPSRAITSAATAAALDRAQVLQLPMPEPGQPIAASQTGLSAGLLIQALPPAVQEVLAMTQSAGNKLAVVLSGESTLVSSLRREPREPRAAGQTRIFRFSAGPFEIIHRKTTQSDV